MFSPPLDEIGFQQVETFCRTWPEGVRVEYKQEPTQIPKNVSSFANTMGGIWLLGVKTDKKTNMPIFPLDGMLAQPGTEERLSQACWTGIYPPLTPAIKVIPLPSNPERVVVAVKVPESIEAPHAIENTTKVYERCSGRGQTQQTPSLLGMLHNPRHNFRYISGWLSRP